ncbi:MAG: alpha/beta hydrolase [Rhodospirillaceae bacterium]|nr:MAG: alpha/beta hydrolase [Rhodospirillaceae bacterium]
MFKLVMGVPKIMVQFFTTLAVFYCVLVAGMYFMQRNFLYHPDNFTPSPAESGVGHMAEISITTEDGLNLLAWAKPPSIEGQPWVVLFHGNAGTLGSRGYKAKAFLDAGFGVLLAEYRGFSGNPGTPTEPGLMMDARAALAYVANLGGSGQNLVLYGESLGTGVATAMAVEAAGHGKPVRTVILEAPFTSTVDVGAGHYPFLPVSLLMKDRFDSLSRIKDIGAPLFIVHGDQDWTVPQKLGRKLFDAAVEPKIAKWVEGAGHNDLFTPKNSTQMIEFIRRHN